MRWPLLLLAACTVAEEPSAPPPAWVYAPPPTSWQLGELRGRFGRSQPPQYAQPLGIAGAAKVPLRRPTVWSVPQRNGAGARAVVFGFEGIAPSIELIDIDKGEVVWRHGTACVEPVIAVTAQAIVCGGTTGIRGVSLAGQPTWQSERALLVATRDLAGAVTRIAVAGDTEGEVIVLGADDGKELWRATLPAGVERASIVGSCEEELFALSANKLQRIGEIKGKQAIAWQTQLAPSPPLQAQSGAGQPAPGQPRPPSPGQPKPSPPSTIRIAALDCSAEPILVSTRPISTFVDGAFAPKPPGAGSIVAIARASGQIASRVDGVRGQWPARDGSDRIEIAVDGQVVSYRRDLGEPIGQTLPPVGELIDARGDRRLVRATPFTAALLDRTGVRAMIPLAQSSHPDVTIRGDAGVELATAAIGDAAIIAGTGTSPGAAVFRIAMPPKLARMVRTTAPHPGTTMPAELRDLPAIAELPRDREIPKVDTGKYGVAAIALDPDPAAQALYAIALELPATTVTTTTIARADLAIKSWTWQRTDGCAAGVPVGIAVAADVVVCASRGQTSTVRATSRDGKAAWDSILLDNVDRVIAGGDAIVAFDADRATVLDTQGKIRGRLMSGDGAQVRAAIVVVPNLEAPGTTASWLVTAERGRLVARLPTVQMLGVWSLDVRGVVRSIEPSGDGVLVVLDDGDAYRVSLRDAAVTAMPGLGLAWRADGELITGAAVGGPVPGVPGVRPFGPPVPPRDAYGKPLDPLDPKLGEAPSVWIPIPAPAPLGDSWQLTLYERGGAFRVRNDYGLAWPIGIGARGPIGSPFVVASAGGALVIDPRTGDPVRRFALPDGGHVFGTIVDGAPVGGVVVGKPLRVVLF